MNNVELQRKIFKQTSWCVVRQQEEEYLLYNSKTDELHLICPIGFYAYQLCDGKTTDADIKEILSLIYRQNKEPLINDIDGFFDKLIKRGVVEVLQ